MNLLDVNTAQSADPKANLRESACISAAHRALLRWAKVISSRKIEDVLSLYAPDAILVPTLSNEIGEREEERRRYFEVFLANEGLQCSITVQKSRVSHKLGTVVIGGLYTFGFRRDGRPQTVPARFLFTFEEIEGRWLITGHHSSRLSEE
ncbi:nuclear transport factor 2 family protein [Brucella intermedia]|uniref:nuclear transport factor 2 family protein n=1 Tax=Brucella intermedia TaxID=94625 RepID=UPI002248A732|nr:nuclear transport factor 2 family protein [Brucella intermedia]